MRRFFIGFAAIAAAALLGASFASGRSAPAGAGRADAATSEAVFAGGCFWCIEADFEKIAGVGDVVSGYTGGDLENPSYEDVTRGGTGHYEAVRVHYDPEVVSYRELVDFFFRHVDPLDAGGQFCDRGASYRTAIFVADDEERTAAEASKDVAAAELDAEVVTPVLELGTFWPAEAYHQDYYKKNVARYSLYRAGCGRDRRVAELWGPRKNS